MSKPVPMDMPSLLTRMERRLAVLERRNTGGGSGAGLATVATAAELSALLASRQPSIDNPLAFIDTRRGYRAVRVTTDGRLFSTTKPEPVPFEYPALGTGAPFKANYHQPGYWVSSAGITVLSGLVSAPAVGGTVMTLPPEARPAGKQMFLVTAADAVGRVDVMQDGQVIFRSGGNSYISLDGIQFPNVSVAPMSAWTPISFVTGWTDYKPSGDLSWPVSAWFQDSQGRIWLQGLATRTAGGAVTGADVTMFTLPSGTGPIASFHYASICAGGFATMDCFVGNGNTAAFRAKIGVSNTAWISLSGASMFTPSLVRPVGDYEQLEPTLSGWANYGAPYPQSSFLRFDDGILTMEGFIRSGTVGPTGTSSWIPEGARPDISPAANSQRAGDLVFPINSSSAFARQDIATQRSALGLANLINYNGSNTWRSLHGINYPIGW